MTDQSMSEDNCFTNQGHIYLLVRKPEFFQLSSVEELLYAVNESVKLCGDEPSLPCVVRLLTVHKEQLSQWVKTSEKWL